MSRNRPRPCGQDTDGALRLRIGFAGQKVGHKTQLVAGFEISQADVSDPDDNVLFRSTASK
jgi:hypothetical protein